jgi:hypothetical protein
MITREDFIAIDEEIKQSLIDTLTNSRNSSRTDYVVFLADGEYKQEYQNMVPALSPFVIDNRVDRYKDETRLKFLTSFMQTYYSFPQHQDNVSDDELRIHMELMIYTHIWESIPFLKKLYRLARIQNNESYEWNVDVPEMGKHNFIRNEIRQRFENQNNNLAEIIRRGFHTSLRNAFAHSEYSFETDNAPRTIFLDNYSGNNWELSSISFDDWNRRFVYSSLLSYHLLIYVHSARTSITNDLGIDIFTIRRPLVGGQEQEVNIRYNPQNDGFSFVNN